jgi:ATP synthase protein I
MNTPLSITAPAMSDPHKIPSSRVDQAGLAVGWMLLGALVVGLGVGGLIDHFFATKPWGMLGSVLLFLAAGMAPLFRRVRK